MILPRLLIACTILGVAACSSGDDAASDAQVAASATAVTSTTIAEDATTTEATEATEATTTSSTSTTTTTIDPAETDKAVYFVAVSKLNPALFEVDERYDAANGILWSDYPAFCGDSIPLYEQFTADIRDHEWRPEVQDEIDALIEANVVATGYYYACRDLPGTAEAQAANDIALADAQRRAQEAVSLARSALGLPLDR